MGINSGFKGLNGKVIIKFDVHMSRVSRGYL